MEQTASLEKDRLPFSSPVCVQISDNTEREVKSVRGRYGSDSGPTSVVEFSTLTRMLHGGALTPPLL